VAAEAEQVEQLEENDLVTGPDPRFLCPSGSYSYVVKRSCGMRRVLTAAATLCPPFGRAQIRRLTRDNRLRTVVHTTRYVPHPSLCPRCAQHLARVYLCAFVGGQAIVRPDELCANCQVRLQEFARCHRREVA
jgi:hypothetical protein